MATPSHRAAGAADGRPSAASRYLFLFLIGLVVGVAGTVMAMRAIDARTDHYPGAVMTVMQAHVSQLQASATANRCSAIDVLPQLQSLRSVANDIEPAFGDAANDEQFAKYASDLRAALDATLASPPLNCPGVGDALIKVNRACKACHDQFRS